MMATQKKSRAGKYRHPHPRAILDFLSDGQWHSQTEIVGACQKSIPLDIVLRRLEQELRYEQDRMACDTKRSLWLANKSRDEQLNFIRRRVLDYTLRNMSDRYGKIKHALPVLEEKQVDGAWYYRLNKQRE